MNAPRTGHPRPPSDVMDRLGVQVEDYLGGRANSQWLVTAYGSRLVLRRYPAEPLGDVGYELSVLQRLKALGWPVPVSVADPIDVDGHIWCLFSWLPGSSQTVTNLKAEQRGRGRLLARLHADTETLVDLGQRSGWRRAEAVVADSELYRQLSVYQRLFPWQARVLRWHAERAHECFDALDLGNRNLLVLYGDFNARNLLFEGRKLTGIVDFEATHLNHRTSDFALAWQGKHDEVFHAYEDVQPLDELDWALLVPTLWSWILLGVAENIRGMTSGSIEPHGFHWQIDRLLRRSPLMRSDAAPYRDN